MERKSTSRGGLALLLAAALALPVLGACAVSGGGGRFEERRLDAEEGWLAVRGVPLVRQETAQGCGAAALAMVLAYWGEPAAADAIAEECEPAPDGGIRARDLRECARRRGLESFLVAGEVSDLAAELSRRRPVLVGTVRAQPVGPQVAHYEVVIALHPARRSVVTLDPAQGPREVPLDEFLAAWEPADRLALVVFRTTTTLASTANPNPRRQE